jgi:hypothetical protein
VYRETIVFTAADSGASRDAPTIFSAAPGANVSLSGSLPLTFAALPAGDPARGAVWLNLTYEWLPPPRAEPFLSAIDGVWCRAEPPLCWDVTVNGRAVQGGLADADAPPGANVSWVYGRYARGGGGGGE